LKHPCPAAKQRMQQEKRSQGERMEKHLIFFYLWRAFAPMSVR